MCEKGQCLSWQVLDKAQGPAMWLPTVGWMVFFSDRNGVSRALPYIELPRLASYCLWSQVQQHIIHKPRTVAIESLFPSVTDSLEGCLGRDPMRSGVAIMIKAK